MKVEDQSAELIQNFGSALENAELMDACLSLCRSFDLEPEDLFYRWESFNYNATASMAKLTLDRIPAFRDHLEREMKRSHAQKAPTTRTHVNMPMKGSSAVGTVKSALGSRMLAEAMATAGASTAPRGPYIKKEEDTEISLLSRPHRADGGSGASSSRNRVVPAVNTKEYSYRYMYEKAYERANALDSRIDQFGLLVKEYYGISDEIADPNADTEEDVVVVGRICDASDSKLTEASLLLEPSRWSGSGRRIPLRLAPNLRFTPDTPASQPSRASRTGVGLFPGAIAAFK
ncbi:DNA-directed DNA polymerase alpha subunit pol12, partial [Tulasnella sp. 403]